jgi:hypothetical protein
MKTIIRYPRCSSCKFFVRWPDRDFWENECHRPGAKPIKLANPNVAGIRVAMCQYYKKEEKK